MPVPGQLPTRSPWTPHSPASAGLPRWYPQLLRGPGYAPWRGALAILVGVVAAVVAVIAISVVAFVIVLLTGGLSAVTDVEQATAELYDNPVIFLANNLALAALIPISGLTVWLCFGWRPRWVSSVVPRLRWGWMLLVFAIALPFHAASVALSMTLDPDPFALTLDGTAIALLVIVLLTTPLQAAGEEYLFRGLLTQAVGSWFARPVAAVVASGASTALLFSAVHGLGAEQDGWLFLGRFAYGLLFSYLVWLTGGLEAAISVHAVNNMAIMVPMALTGGLGAAITQGEGDALSTVTSIAVMVVIALILTPVARRRGLATRHDPAMQPGGERPHQSGPGGFVSDPDLP